MSSPTFVITGDGTTTIPDQFTGGFFNIHVTGEADPTDIGSAVIQIEIAFAEYPSNFAPMISPVDGISPRQIKAYGTLNMVQVPIGATGRINVTGWSKNIIVQFHGV